MNRAVVEQPEVSVAEGYERWAPHYDDDPNPLLAREERHLQPLLQGLRGKSVLDLACGTGRWLERATKQGAAFAVGIDNSAPMLHVANQKSAIRTRLAGADCESLPFPDATFDLAICSFALGHFHNLGRIVDELARVAKNGADVFISDLHPDASARGWRVGFRYAGAAIHIKTQPRTVEEVVQAFCSTAFECEAQEALRLGQSERHIFDRAGKSDYFLEACGLPAVLFCHFRRTGLRRERESSGKWS